MIARTTILLALAATNVVVAYLQQWYLLIRIGPGLETDALFAAMVVPWAVLAMAGDALSSVLVPLLTTQSATARCHTTWQFLHVTAAGFGLGSLLLGASAAVWVPIIFPGFSSQQLRLCVSLTQIQLLGLVVNSLVAVLTASAYARGEFVRVEWATLAANLLGGAFLVGSLDRIGVAALAWGLVVKYCALLTLLLPRIGPFQAFDWKAQGVKSALRRASTLVIGASYYKTDLVVDRYLTSLAAPGVLSLFHFAQQLYSAGAHILTKGLVSPLIPRLASAAHSGDWQDFIRIWWKGCFAAAVFAVLVYLVLASGGEPVLRLVFGHQRFSPADVHTLWTILVALGGFWFGGILGGLAAGSWYAMRDTRTPTLIGVLSYTVYLPFKVLAFFRYGILGLALSATIYYLTNLAILSVFALLRARRESADISVRA